MLPPPKRTRHIAHSALSALPYLLSEAGKRLAA